MSIDLNLDAALLQGLADEVRSKTLELLAAAGDDELLWTPPGLQNHLLWQAGHVLWVQDKLCVEAITGENELPDGWVETFSMNCRPPRETTDWPTRSEIRERLAAQLPRLIELMGTLTTADLAGWARTKSLGREQTLWYWITHGLHDEANHQGEMYLLLKSQRAAE